DLGWDAAAAFAPLGPKVSLSGDVEQLLERLLEELAAGDNVVLMSNGSFQGLPQKLERALEARAGGKG
ncbi:MAG TPA: UDP-N-acetylmuramate:L-alanyl-gamma-D-glutamyl-meso-diaminopimelate ligase, partial [Gammaproteobacteria bacterium]|nr:UDP-N-acetylmuramate:L-alanyl-gamma-D-glutamyl-meso-diaminopimelate ligase [Gammaproteobacteria bacterium]